MILAFDTSGRDCGVALWKDSSAGVRIEEGALRHNEKLLEMMLSLMSEKNVAKQDLEAIAVSAGPGSFTGLRVGLATAKGLCMAWDIPLITVPTLESLAESVPKCISNVLALMPARAKEVYWALYINGQEERKKEGDIRVDDIEQLNQLCAGSLFLVGEGYKKHQSELDRIFQDRRLTLAASESVENPVVSIARLGAKRFRNGQFDDLMNSEPNYCYAFPRRTA
jgi:tRNA threonylcarbamoyladenosine biosynthesis protein TsaB